MANSRDGFEVDLTDYKDRMSARLEPGKYLVRITDGEIGETKDTKAPKVVLYYTVVGTSFNGQPLVDHLPLSGKAVFRIVQVMRALSVTVDKGKKFVVPFNKMINRTMCVTVVDGDEYNGQVKSQVQSYAPASMYEGHAEKELKEDTNADAMEQEAAAEEEHTYTEEFDGEDAHGWAARANEVDLPEEQIAL